MMAAIGMLGFAAAAIGSLAMSVAAGQLLLKGMLRMMESAVRDQGPVADVTDLSEYVRRTTAPLASDAVDVRRAA